jgi:hypothetical protein
MRLPAIEGIMFDDAAYELVSAFIARLKLDGDFAVYGLPGFHNGTGEVRLAHHGSDINRRAARGVFCRFIPSTTGAIFTHDKKVGEARIRTRITASNFDAVLWRIIAHRDLIKDRVRGFERVDPNKPGTVSAGQFESNRRKH